MTSVYGNSDQWFYGTYYLSGQMRPLPENNFPLFARATRILRSHGFSIISPHEMGEATWTRGQLMADDLITLLKDCDGVIVLPGWQKSPGASAEVACAFATEKPVFEVAFNDNDTFVIQPCKDVSLRVPRENQYRDGTPLVGLCGFAQSGKDTAAAYLVKEFGFTRVAFADALRDVLYALDPIAHVDSSFGDYATYSVQELVDEHGWDKAKTEYAGVRQLLQRLGTEAGREVIDQQLWVGMGEDKIERAGGPVVVTDCRFPNEVELIRRRKGTLIWVERDGVGAVNAHASEHSVSPVDCDLILTNNGTLDDLHKSLSQVFGKVINSK